MVSGENRRGGSLSALWMSVLGGAFLGPLFSLLGIVLGHRAGRGNGQRSPEASAAVIVGWIGLAMFPITVATLGVGLWTAREVRRDARVRSSIKDLTKAAIEYADAHEGQAATDWPALLDEGRISPALLRHPRAPRDAHVPGFAIAFQGALTNRESLKNLPLVVDLHPDTWDRIWVGWTDGSANRVPTTDSLQRKAERGTDAAAPLRLASRLRNGVLTERNIDEAIAWYAEAADRGSAKAMYEIGSLFMYDETVERDEALALEWFRAGAELGHADCAYSIGLAYYRGQGVPTNPNAALRWFRRAAKLGDKKAAHVVGHMRATGEGVETNASLEHAVDNP